MLSDSIILKKIERQPKRTAGFKQMVRELAVRGDDRRELSERLKNWSPTDNWCRSIPTVMPCRKLPAGKESWRSDD